MCLHLVGLLTIYVLPRFVRGAKRVVSSSAEEKTAQPGADAANTEGNNKSDTVQRAENVKLVSHNDDEKSNICDTECPNGVSQQPKNNDHTNSSAGQDENLSHLIRKRIDSETRNLEKLVETSLDKTVTNIVEFKEDLMRVSDDERLAVTIDGLRQRHPTERVINDSGVDIFLKREITAAVNQVNVLPAVLSNGHGAD